MPPNGAVVLESLRLELVDILPNALLLLGWLVPALGLTIFLVSALGMGIRDRDRRRSRHGMGLLVVALSLLALSAGATRETAAQETHQVQPRFTRIFASDALDISGASMSPDGRWIMFGALDFAAEATDDVEMVSRIYMMPTEGGDPIPLTSGNQLEDGAVWFPGGDRIAFRSSKAGMLVLMTLPIDTVHGGPAGPPRQVTLEGSAAYFDVSPDGDWIAYTPLDENTGARLLRIVPSTGGHTRTLGETRTSAPFWSADGESVYHIEQLQEAGEPLAEAVVRTSVDGARRDTVFAWPGMVLAPRSPNTQYVLRAVEPAWPRSYEQPIIWNLATREGRSLGDFTLPGNMWPGTFLRDEVAFLARRNQASAPLRILPVEGGMPRIVGDSHSTDDPVTWTPDGEEVLFSTRLDGREVLMVAPVAGGSVRELALPPAVVGEAAGFKRFGLEVGPVFSADGEYYLVGISPPGSATVRLHVVNRTDGASRLLTDQAAPFEVFGSEGLSHRDGDDFVWVESEGRRHRLWASPPEGPRRLLLSYEGAQAPEDPASSTADGRIAVAIHGDRIAVTEMEETGTALSLAHRGGQARGLIGVQGWLGEMKWSPDGSRLAMVHYPVRDGSPLARIAFLDVTAAGEVPGGLRTAGRPMLAYWSLNWLPDGEGVLVVDLNGSLWRIPSTPGEEPVALTRDEPGPVWGYALSPDGHHIACSPRIPSGGSIWKVEIPRRE